LSDQSHGFTIVDQLLARALVLAFLDEDYDQEIELARRLAKLAEKTEGGRYEVPCANGIPAAFDDSPPARSIGPPDAAAGV
jgi:hypothetical protein